MKKIFFIIVAFFAITLSVKGQGSTCLAADPFCTGSPITFPAGVGSGTAQVGPDYGCLLTQPNPAWYWMEMATGGNLDITITNSNGEDIDFILWGPFVDPVSPCTALLTAGNTVDCSYSTSATEIANIVGAIAGEHYLMLITNFSNNPTNITFSDAPSSTATTNCAIVCPPIAFGQLNTTTGQIDPLPATLSCDDAAFAVYADQDGFTTGQSITPSYVVQVFPTNGIGTNSMEFFENSTSIGGFGSIGVTSAGAPWTSAIGSNTNFSGYVSYVSPSNNPHAVQLCNNTAGANSTYQILDAHSGVVLATGTWIGSVGCQTVTLSNPPVLSGLATWSTTCGAASLPLVTDWGAAIFDPSALPPGTICNLTYNWDDQTGNCSGSQTQTITITSPFTATSLGYTTPVCQSVGGTISPSLVATGGGAYSSVPGGLSMNASGVINLAASTPGTYTVTYFIGTALPSTCNATVNTSVTITAETTPTFTQVNTICSGDALANLPTTSNNGVTGTWSPAMNNTSTTGYTFTPTAGLCATTQTMTITVTPNTTPSFTQVNPICSGDPLAVLPTTSNNGVTGTWSPAMNNTGTTGYTFTPTAGLCATTQTMTITVTPNTTPTFTQVNPICSGDALTNLPTTSNNGVTGTWSPAMNNTGTTGYTFTPTAGLCATTQTMTITVTPNTTPTFTQVNTICSGDPLAALPTTSNNGVTGTWSPTINNTTTTVYTFTPTAGLCSPTQNMTITVTPNTTPTFTQVNTICSGDPLAALPTTSTNGVTGTWSPAMNNTGTTGYTFTPTAGLCATTQTMTITVTPNISPTFTQVNPICSGDALANLSTTSNNGVTGTWSPAIDNTTTTVYTFTPTAGLCSPTTTMTIMVTPNTTPTFTQVNTICSGDALANLPTTSNNGVTGTWSPAMNNTSTTVYTFIPTAGLCSPIQTMTITVTPNTTPTFTQVNTICSGDPLAVLPTTSNNGVTGTWSPAINNTGTTLYTFTPTAGLCATTQTMTITITPITTPTFTQVTAICDGDPLVALPTTSSNGVTGTWSPVIDNTTTTLYTFTPSAGLCSPNTTMTITVNPNDDPNFAYASGTYCLTGTDPLPSVITTPGGTFTINAPGVINSGDGTIDLGLSGLGGFTVTYNTPAGNLCQTSTTFPITITAAPSAAFTYNGLTYCQDATAPVLTYGAGASGGVFTSVPGGLTINPGTGAVDPSTSTPGLYTVTNSIAAAGGCASALETTIIEIFQVDSALFNYATLTHCLTGSDPLATMGGNATGGGVFTITAPGVINAGDGTIDLALSGLGTYTVYYNTTAAGNPCPSVDSVIINIVNAPGANFTYSGPFCEGDTITVLPTFGANGFAGVFSSNPGGITFVSTVTGEINLLTSSAGTFTIYNNLAASGGCAAVVDSFQIVVNPIFTTAANTSICTGDSILLGGIFQNSAGTYNDTLATTFGCDSIIQTTLAVNPIVTNPQSAAICIGDSILLGGVFQTTGGVYNDTLFTNLGCDSIVQTTLTVNTVILTALNDSICQGDSVLLGGNFQTTAGVYNDTLAAVAGCDSVLVTTLIINLIDSVVINTIDTICLSDPLILVGTGNGSGTITWYSDAAGTTVVGTGSPLVLSNPGVGIHTYYVNSVGICSSNIGSVTIVVGGVNAVINATPVTGAIPLNVFFGNGSTTGPGITYVWDFGDGSTSNIFEPSNTYNAIGNYTVMLIVSDGICSDTTIITIDAYGESVILIPNIFTPNEDGSNDLFTVDGVNLESVEGEIYNRWGQKMFSWDNVKGSWDGRTLAGSEAPDGTYFYIITAKGFDGTEYSEKGGFSLIR